jgi:hypothetical protein
LILIVIFSWPAFPCRFADLDFAVSPLDLGMPFATVDLPRALTFGADDAMDGDGDGDGDRGSGDGVARMEGGGVSEEESDDAYGDDIVFLLQRAIFLFCRRG